MNEPRAASQYNKVNIQTAGKLKSYLLLLERIQVLLSLPEAHLDPVKSRIQNIFVQIQISLNLRTTLGRQIHKGLAHLWDALEYEEEEALPRILQAVDTLRRTIQDLDRA